MDAVDEFFDRVIKDLEADSKSKNQKIPVNWRKEITETGGNLYNEHYFKFLTKEEASAPGKMRPVDDIMKWVEQNIKNPVRENKDGTFSRIPFASVAYAIAVTLMKKGSKIYQGEKPGIDFFGVLQKNMPFLVDTLAKNTVMSIATTLRNATTIICFAFLLGSCSPKLQTDNTEKVKKIKSEKTISVGQTFLMVGCFMLGYGVTNEYFIKE